MPHLTFMVPRGESGEGLLPAVPKMKCVRACNENLGILDLCLALISPK